MKLSVKPELIKLLSLAAGVCGMMLRLVLFASGTDEKGLLISGHWAGRGLWILTIAMVVMLFLLSRTVHGPKRYRDAHPVSVFAFAGNILAAFAIARTTVTELRELPLIAVLLGLAAAVSLLVIAYCRIRPCKPNFLLHCVVCVFFAYRMISQYRNWNSDPQVLDYAFYLGAHIALMLTAYQHAAFDAGMINHRTLWCCSLLAAYLCFVSLTATTDTFLLLSCGIWSFTNVTCLKTRNHHPRYARKEE